jgi:hypothetical protein
MHQRRPTAWKTRDEQRSGYRLLKNFGVLGPLALHQKSIGQPSSYGPLGQVTTHDREIGVFAVGAHHSIQVHFHRRVVLAEIHRSRLAHDFGEQFLRRERQEMQPSSVQPVSDCVDQPDRRDQSDVINGGFHAEYTIPPGEA